MSMLIGSILQIPVLQRILRPQDENFRAPPKTGKADIVVQLPQPTARHIPAWSSYQSKRGPDEKTQLPQMDSLASAKSQSFSMQGGMQEQTGPFKEEAEVKDEELGPEQQRERARLPVWALDNTPAWLQYRETTGTTFVVAAQRSAKPGGPASAGLASLSLFAMTVNFKSLGTMQEKIAHLS